MVEEPVSCWVRMLGAPRTSYRAPFSVSGGGDRISHGPKQSTQIEPTQIALELKVPRQLFFPGCCGPAVNPNFSWSHCHETSAISPNLSHENETINGVNRRRQHHVRMVRVEKLRADSSRYLTLERVVVRESVWMFPLRQIAATIHHMDAAPASGARAS